MTRKFTNKRREAKLQQISSQSDFLSKNSDHTTRSKVNFSYLDVGQAECQDFSDLSKNDLCKLLNKLKEHGKKSLVELQRTPIGRGTGKKRKRRTILEIYGDFPSKRNTYLEEPLHIPAQAQWGRIRLESSIRIAGFIVPPELHGQRHAVTNEFFDKNTFYVVFIDMNHKFYTNKK